MTTLVYPKRPRKGSGYSFTQNRKRGMDGFGEALLKVLVEALVSENSRDNWI